MKRKDILEGFGRRDAYQRDYDSSVRGFGRGSDHRGLDQELAHERNNYVVAINGKEWKVFADKRQAQNVAAAIERKTGKKTSVHPTGADPTVDEGEGKVTAADPTKGVEITNPETGVKTTIPPKMSSALAPDKANPNRYTLNTQAVAPGTDKDTATGPKVGSQVAIPDQAKVEDLSQIRKLAGL